METDLQLAKTVKLRKKYRAKGDSERFLAISPSVATLRPVVSRKFGRGQQVYLNLFLVPFTVAAKTFRAALEFINAHLQQRDQVARELRTVDFWLIVCGDTRVLSVATK